MLLLGNESYESIFNFLNSIFGKFFIIGFVWSYSFQILSEIRHWFWDLGYGFELKTSKISGILVILGSIIMTIIIYSLRGFLI
jgi:succinate dehydrogenase / fumarate reductase cytochrome b subunit|tara:strand:- start:477 stop:725 length:249 start_codon:yes stop_codon:yes gene_type:complete